MIRFLCLTALGLALSVTAPVHSQSRRELAERIDATEARIAELEASFLAGDPVAETLIRRLDALDYQIQEMTGTIERLTHENRQLRNQVSDLETDLAARNTSDTSLSSSDNDAMSWMTEGLDAGEAGEGGLAVTDSGDPHAEARAAATRPLGGTELAEPVSNPDELYEEARRRLFDGDFAGAQFGFETFVSDHADDPRSGDALYWLGETFFVRNQYAEAADAYIASLRARSDGERAQDALVRLAASLHGLGRTGEACATLSRFSGQFPNASQASRDRAARERVRAGC